MADTVKRSDGKSDETPIEHAKGYKDEKPAVASSNSPAAQPQGKPYKLGAGK